MTSDQRSVITSAIAKAPEWVRHDLAAKDEPVRRRAEETLAAMIAAALAEEVAARAHNQPAVSA